MRVAPLRPLDLPGAHDIGHGFADRGPPGAARLSGDLRRTPSRWASREPTKLATVSQIAAPSGGGKAGRKDARAVLYSKRVPNQRSVGKNEREGTEGHWGVKGKGEGEGGRGEGASRRRRMRKGEGEGDVQDKRVREGKGKGKENAQRKGKGNGNAEWDGKGNGKPKRKVKRKGKMKQKSMRRWGERKGEGEVYRGRGCRTYKTSWSRHHGT